MRFCLEFFSLTSGMERELREAGLPVKGVFSPPGLKFALLLVSVEKGHPGIANKVVSAIRASKMGVFFQYVAVVEDDIAVTDIPQILHNVFTRAHPERGLHVMELAPGHPLIPFLDLHDKMHSRGSTMCLDATTPSGWDSEKDSQDRISFNSTYPEVIKEKVMENWKDYALDLELNQKTTESSTSKEEAMEV